jgi:hypothetical protein
MTAYMMDPARDADGNGQPGHETLPAVRRSETWTFPPMADATTDEDSADMTPRVSLFSPSVAPIMPAAPSDAASSSRSRADSYPTAPLRPSPSLGAISGMAKRSGRLRVSEHPAIMKSSDDPNTPQESPGRRTTTDLMRHERTTMTSLSKLFSDTAMPGSRAPSYNNATGPLYLRASNEAIPLPDHLYTRGLLEGRHSDITVIAFEQRYNLHRLILDRAPFFTTALSEPWVESRNKEVPLHPEQTDTNITQASFELAIRKLYGVDISQELDVEAVGLFATGCWLEMQDLIDAAIESILRQMAPDTLAYLIRLVTANYYGRSGDRILESAKAMLSRDGWEMQLKYWDDMPGDIIRELVGSDGFYVESEWDRWVLAKRLLDRRLRQGAVEAGLIQRGQKPVPQAPGSLGLMAVRFDGVYRQNALTATHASTDAQGEWLALYTHPDIERILVLLDEGIHYIHMDYEQLDCIKNARDVFGLPVMPDRVMSSALWQQLALRQTILNADESAQELGLCQMPQAPESPNAATKTEGTTTTKGKSKAVAAADAPEIASESWDGNGRARKFWIPSSDCNIVLGNGADPVVTPSNTFQRHVTRLSASIQPEDAQWATDFASTPSTMAHPQIRPISAGGGNAGQPTPISYTEYPPFRFSAEFPNPRFLRDKRVYSRTVSYAGSLWNIYVQKIKSSKNVQLGVYLHRAKDREVDDAAQGNTLSQQNNGSVGERISQLEPEMISRDERRDLRRNARAVMSDQAAEDDTSGSGGDIDSNLATVGTPLFASSSLGRRRSATIPRLSTHLSANYAYQTIGASPRSAANSNDAPTYETATYSPSDNDSSASDDDDVAAAYPNPSLISRPLPRTRSSMPALPPYVDSRPTIKTYFKIYSPSKGGRMLSIYESAPDRFNFQQSWGWKSSTLMLDEKGKLRFMVVIGNL